MSGKLAGSTLFITGASRGIGKAIALRAARDGANIVIAAKTATPHPKLPGTIYTAAKEVEEAGGQCLPCEVDIREESQVKAAVDKAVARFGGIDILVNNASAISLTGTVDTTMKKSKYCIPHLMKSKNPHILNITPPLNMRPRWFAEHYAYSMAKYGSSLCVLGMAEELKPHGIAVNGLWPHVAVATAAVEKFGGQTAMALSRKPEIMGDAAHIIFTKTGCELTGQFLIDDKLLMDHGVTDIDQYAYTPGATLLPDAALDEGKYFRARLLTPKSQDVARDPGSATNVTPEAVFRTAQSLITPELAQEVGATFLFVLDGKNPGNWLIDLKYGSGSVSTAQQDMEADVVMQTSSDNLVAMFTGKLNPTVAFTSGKLRIKGNMAAAMLLVKLTDQVKSKLTSKL